VKIRKN
jgi:hypothetical protein